MLYMLIYKQNYCQSWNQKEKHFHKFCSSAVISIAIVWRKHCDRKNRSNGRMPLRVWHLSTSLIF